MTIDQRFALVTKDGDVLFPYTKTEKTSNRTGFAISAPGERDAKGGAVFTTDLKEVVRRVIFDGWKVRAKTIPPAGPRDGSYGFQMKVIDTYWIDPELASWAEGATIPPLTGALPVSRVAWPFSEELTPEERIVSATQEDYAEALSTIWSSISEPQKAMLLGHARASNSTLSMEAIAAYGGYENHNAGNSQYGILGRLFAGHFAIEGLANQTQAIAFLVDERDVHGHAQWRLREPLLQALKAVGKIEESGADSVELAAATAVVDADPQCQDLSPTTRQALINARIGQGDFRRDLLRVWRGRCAVTGCSVTQVLIASHAKPWKDSSNRERLDAFNGLLLVASLDRLFDQGLIGFTDDGHLLKKPQLSNADLQTLGLSPIATLSSVDPRHRPYLAAHRAKFDFSP